MISLSRTALLLVVALLISSATSSFGQDARKITQLDTEGLQVLSR